MAKVQGMMPIVGRKQHVDTETGQVVEGHYILAFLNALQLTEHDMIIDWELVFADDEREANPTSFKFLQMAHAWKNSQAKKAGGSGLLSGFTAAASTSENPPLGTNESGAQDVEMGREDDTKSDVSSSDDE